MKKIQTQPATPLPYARDLVWVEPKDFRRAEQQQTKGWLFKMVCLIAVIGGVFLVLARRLHWGAESYRNLLLATGGIILLFVVARLTTGLMRMVVKITAKAISWELNESRTVYRFGTIDHCELAQMVVEQRKYPVLVVALTNGDREIFAVAATISNQLLGATLEQRGIKVITRTDPITE